MSREHKAAVSATRDTEFERYYNELLLSVACSRAAYYAHAADNTDMTKTFARDLAAHLQRKTGYVCKVGSRGDACIGKGYYVKCSFKDVPPSLDFNKLI